MALIAFSNSSVVDRLGGILFSLSSSFSPFAFHTNDEKIYSLVIGCSSVVHTFSPNPKNSPADISCLVPLLFLNCKSSLRNSLKGLLPSIHEKTITFITSSIEIFCKETFLSNDLINFLITLFDNGPWNFCSILDPWLEYRSYIC